MARPRLVGINHVALEVGDIDQALDFYGRIFEITLRGLDFLDPWGNRVQVVQYDEIQFTKAEPVLRGMGLDLDKGDAARAELRAKGLDGT
jgi:Glyoxalase/Bleomycin resistance protein/Dioxygenase superfamily